MDFVLLNLSLLELDQFKWLIEQVDQKIPPYYVLMSNKKRS